MFILNDKQIKAERLITNFLDSSKIYFLLEGDPGTGKTTIITKIFDNDRFKKKKIAFCATTNKAVSILQQYSTLKGKNIIYTTIQKLLNIKRNIDENGKEVYASSFSCDNKYHIKNYDVILIDEASMISSSILNEITYSSRRYKCKIIFIGDRNQLPPVNEDVSEIFNMDYGENQINLDKIERFKNDILKYTYSIKDSKKIKMSQLNKNDVVFYKIYKDWIDNYVKNIDSSIILTYTNNKKRMINNYIRNILFPNLKNKYNIGEKIVFNNFYSTQENKFYSSQHASIIGIDKVNYKFNPLPVNKLLDLSITLNNNLKNVISNDKKSCPICLEEDIDVMQQTKCNHLFCGKCINIWLKQNNCCPLCRFVIEGDTIKIKDNEKITNLINSVIKRVCDVEMKVLKIKISTSIFDGEQKKNITDFIYVISEDSKQDYNLLCEFIKKSLLEIKKYISSKNRYNNIILRRLWEFFYNNYIDVLADIDYGYCITVHKSQGSTYTYVYVNLKDIVNNNKTDTKNCVYTAITRASEKLLVLK